MAVLVKDSNETWAICVCGRPIYWDGRVWLHDGVDPAEDARMCEGLVDEATPYGGAIVVMEEQKGGNI